MLVIQITMKKLLLTIAFEEPKMYFTWSKFKTRALTDIQILANAI